MTVQGDIADEEFSQYFSQFGDIEDCVVSRHCMHHKHMCCLSALPVTPITVNIGSMNVSQ